MASGDVARVLRAPGRLIVNPQERPRDFAFPYRGIEIGKANGVSLAPVTAQFLVHYEATGSVGDILEANLRWVAACFLRGWDDDAIRLLARDGYREGGDTQHASYRVPGDQVPGSSVLDRAVKLLFVPDDPVFAPGFIAYRAVPDWTANMQFEFARNTELGLPLTFELVRDNDGRIMEIGRIEDLEL